MYVIFNRETTRIFPKIDARFKTMAAAKAARTKAENAGEIDATEYDIAEVNHFLENIEKLVEKTNLSTGEKFVERVNTPHYCSPSSESYWSM